MKRENGFSISVTGSSHLKKNLPCQDRSGYYSNTKYSAIVVCDGHGGQKHFRSGIGAEIALRVVGTLLDCFSLAVIKEKREHDCYKKLKEFEKSIIFHWREAVKDHYNNQPFSDIELSIIGEQAASELLENIFLAYGTTLLSVIEIGEFVYIIKLGDGNCVEIQDDQIFLPVEFDEKLQFNYTTSLCSNHAFNDIKDVVIEKKCGSVYIISSDGVYNSFENEQAYFDFMEMICQNIRTQDIKNQLTEFLPILSKNGSGDDVSLAILYDDAK